MNDQGINNRLITIVVAVSDPDDHLLIKMAIDEARLVNRIIYLSSAAELMEYLYHTDQYAVPASAPRPGLIFINPLISGMDGIHAIKKIQSDQDLSGIPLVLMIGSENEREFVESQTIEQVAFMDLPVTPEGLYKVLIPIPDLWFGIVTK